MVGHRRRNAGGAGLLVEGHHEVGALAGDHRLQLGAAGDHHPHLGLLQIGLLIALAGAYMASVGNVVSTRHAKQGVPVTQANAFGMAYGGVLTLCIHFLMGGTLTMDWSVGYLGPMLYLTVFGSIAAFGCYMLLISRVGAEYAAYVTLLMPLIALVLSTLFEGYHWTANASVGVALVLAGNLIILMPQTQFRRAFYRLHASRV